jgi:hypothetical protein
MRGGFLASSFRSQLKSILMVAGVWGRRKGKKVQGSDFNNFFSPSPRSPAEAESFHLFSPTPRRITAGAIGEVYRTHSSTAISLRNKIIWKNISKYFNK